jgi:tetratricopeptide (TPR) repeat protein
MTQLQPDASAAVETFGFLASPFADERMKTLRLQVHDLASRRGKPIWVAEVREPALKPNLSLDPFEIADTCMAAVRNAGCFILLTDGSFGTRLRYGEYQLSSSYIEMEIFQASANNKRVHVVEIGETDPNSPIGKLLSLLKVAYGTTEWRRVDTHRDALAGIDAILARYPKRRSAIGARYGRSRAMVGAFAGARHRDWQNRRLGLEVSFLDDSFESLAQRPDPSVISGLLDEAAAAKGSQLKLARNWMAIRELMAAPFSDPACDAYLTLWDDALGRWASTAAWYGMHAHLFLGHQAALGSLLKIRERLGKKAKAASGHTASMDGALASCYYSLSKISPRSQSASFLDRSLGYAQRGIEHTPSEPSAGLYAILGSIKLRQGHPKDAVHDYRRALDLAEDEEGSSARCGEYLAELGWSEIRAGQGKIGIRHLREGVRLMDGHSEPGFLVRGRRKLGYGLLTRFDLTGSFREFVRARDLAASHQLEGQLQDPALRIVDKIVRTLEALGLDLPRDAEP